MSDFSKYGGKSDEFRRLEATLPTPPEQTLEELRKATNGGREDAARKTMEALGPKVSMKDYSIPTRDGSQLQARTYKSSLHAAKVLPIYIHYHGGGFFFGTLQSEDATCSQIALDVDVVVLNVEYRHSPEFAYPTAWDDAEDTYAWACEHANEVGGDKTQIVVGGISAGGQLAASLAQTLHRERSPLRDNLVGQVLMIPCLVHQDCYDEQRQKLSDPSVSSLIENEFAPILPLTRMRMFNSLLHRVPPVTEDRRLNPANATPEEVSKLPPAVFGICGLDPLRDEALLYAQLLHESGVPTTVSVFKGVPHGFRRFGDKLAVCKDWDRVMHEGIKWALTKPKMPSNQDIAVY